MVHTANSCKTPTSARSFSHLPTRLPKNVDIRDLTSSNRYSDDLSYIYKISMENMTGMRDPELDETESSMSFRNSSSDEESVRSEGVPVNFGERSSNGGLNRFDFIHPVLPDDRPSLMCRSFQEEKVPAKRKVQLQRRCASYSDADIASSNKGRSRLTTVHSLESNDETSLRVPVRSVPAPALHSPLMNRSMHMWTTPPGTDSPPLPPRARWQNTPPVITTSVGSPPLPKLRRSRKVLTSRESLDSTSRWLHPSLSSPDERLMGEQVDQRGHRTTRVGGYAAQNFDRSTSDNGSAAGYMRSHEVLGQLENVVYSDSGIHHDLSLSSNYSDAHSNLKEKYPHQ